jgi:hypothetical protein
MGASAQGILTCGHFESSFFRAQRVDLCQGSIKLKLTVLCRIKELVATLWIMKIRFRIGPTQIVPVSIHS